MNLLAVRDIELNFCRGREGPPPSSDRLINVHKPWDFIEALNETLGQLHPRRIVEVGILDGGSSIYWQHKYNPECLITIDIRPVAPHFVDFLTRHGLLAVVHPYFGVSQNDAPTLRKIVSSHLEPGSVDVVIDDASHSYQETRITLETLLPFIRPGGAYIIEDWAWGPWL